MRLFQSQEYLEDHVPPPPYNMDREATRVMPLYLNQFRDGKQRLPTPEKVAIMELSSSFERRRLGKHQQILTDITQRCREQEVSDLCSSISAKVNLRQPSTGMDRMGKEMTFYSTNYMGQKLRPGGAVPDMSQFVPTLPIGHEESKPSLPKVTFEKTYKNFPARKVIRQHTKFDFVKGSTFPKLASPNVTGLSPEHILHRSYKLSERRNFHGSTQSGINKNPRPEHNTTRSEHLAPLIMPGVGYNDFLANTDRMDTYFLTNRLTLGARTRTHVTLDSNRSGKGQSHSNLKPIKMTFARDISQLHLETGGNSPPPNSEQELTMEAVTV